MSRSTDWCRRIDISATSNSVGETPRLLAVTRARGLGAPRTRCKESEVALALIVEGFKPGVPSLGVETRSPAGRIIGRFSGGSRDRNASGWLSATTLIVTPLGGLSDEQSRLTSAEIRAEDQTSSQHRRIEEERLSSAFQSHNASEREDIASYPSLQQTICV